MLIEKAMLETMLADVRKRSVEAYLRRTQIEASRQSLLQQAQQTDFELVRLDGEENALLGLLQKVGE